MHEFMQCWLSVRLRTVTTVTYCRYCIETADVIPAADRLILYLRFKRIRVLCYLQKSGYFVPERIVPNSELSRLLTVFRHGVSTVASAVNLVRPSHVDHTQR